MRLGEKEALDSLLRFFEQREALLPTLEYYQERRLKRLGLLDDSEWGGRGEGGCGLEGGIAAHPGVVPPGEGRLKRRGLMDDSVQGKGPPAAESESAAACHIPLLLLTPAAFQSPDYRVSLLRNSQGVPHPGISPRCC